MKQNLFLVVDNVSEIQLVTVSLFVHWRCILTYRKPLWLYPNAFFLRRCFLVINISPRSIVFEFLGYFEYPRQPSLWVTLNKATFSLLLRKIQPIAYIRIANPSREARLISGNPGKRDNFSSNKRFGSPNRDNSPRAEESCNAYISDLKHFKRIREMIINSVKPTVIEWPRETQR